MARLGRLPTIPIRTTTTYNEDECASECLDSRETCLSFNYDFGESQTCELLREIESPLLSLNEVQIKCLKPMGPTQKNNNINNNDKNNKKQKKQNKTKQKTKTKTKTKKQTTTTTKKTNKQTN